MKLHDHPTDLYIDTWGIGTPVVLVHGSLAIGTDEWAAQHPLAELGFQLTVFDRRGYGHNAGPSGEDFLADADDIVELIGDGAHVVGHSYGGLGAMFAAARRPEATLSLTLLEPPAIGLAHEGAAWRQLADNVTAMWTSELTDREWVVEFLTAVGSDPTEFPPEFLDTALASVPVLRSGRPFFEADVPYGELAAAEFPKLVVSGGHHPGFESMCRQLATTIGASHEVIEGAGHEIQFTGDALNARLIELWSTQR